MADRSTIQTFMIRACLCRKKRISKNHLAMAADRLRAGRDRVEKETGPANFQKAKIQKIFSRAKKIFRNSPKKDNGRCRIRLLIMKGANRSKILEINHLNKIRVPNFNPANNLFHRFQMPIHLAEMRPQISLHLEIFASKVKVRSKASVLKDKPLKVVPVLAVVPAAVNKRVIGTVSASLITTLKIKQV